MTSPKVNNLVGASWESPEGTRVVEGTIERDGETRYLVRTGDGRTVDLVPREWLERMREIDAANLAYRAKEEERDRERREREEARERDRRDFDGFTDGMTPVHAGRVAKTLNRVVLYKGRPISRRDLIREKVAAGAYMDRVGGSPIVMGRDGAFFDQKALTQIGLDYARYLIERRDAQAAVA